MLKILKKEKCKNDMLITNNIVLTEGFLDTFNIKEKVLKNLSKLKNFFFIDFKKKETQIKNILEKNNIDVSEIELLAKKATTKIKIQNGTFVGYREAVNNFVNSDFVKKHLVAEDAPTLLPNNTKLESPFSFDKVQTSLVIFIIVYFMSILFLHIAAAIVGPATANIIYPIFFAPIIEELGKLISVQKDATASYFVIFNIVEYTNHVNSLLMMNVSTVTAFISSIIPVYLHFVLTMIHVESKKSKKEGIGYLISVVLHGMWNALVTLK